MTPLPVVLTVVLCLGGPHCRYSRPVFFPTWDACARAGEAMVSHARTVARGDVSFTCEGIGQ